VKDEEGEAVKRMNKFLKADFKTGSEDVAR
jgi:hypothetical protein